MIERQRVFFLRLLQARGSLQVLGEQRRAAFQLFKLARSALGLALLAFPPVR